MKSALITDSGINKESGGGVVSYNLFDALDRCTEVQYVFSNQDFENNRYNGIPAYNISPVSYGYSYSDIDKRFSPFLQDYLAYHLIPMETNLDIVQTYGCPFGLTIEEIKATFECKVIADVAPHDISISQGEHMKFAGKYPFIHLTDELLWGLYARNLKLADVVIVHSHSSANYLKEHAPLAEKPRVIPHGIYLPSEIPPYPDGLKPGYFGAIGWDKGWVYIVRAWMAMFHENGPFTQRQEFIMGGKDTAGFRVQDNYTRYFKILGEVEKISDFYKQINVYVQASVTEGFGITVLEAMAHGRPVIVTEGTGASELIHDGKEGFVVPIRDERAITRKMTWFYDNPDEIEKMGKEARKTAEKYTWDKIQDEYIEIYKEIT